MAVVAGCGSTSTPQLATNSTSKANVRAASDPATPGPLDELTADDAKSQDALVAQYDAFLSTDTVEGAKAHLTLQNVGKERDRYTLTLEPAHGSVSPQSVELNPGDSAQIEATLTEQVDLVVTSEGRGEPVAAATLTPQP